MPNTHDSAAAPAHAAHRRKLSDTRPSISHKRQIGDLEVFIIVGFFDGPEVPAAAACDPGEVFIKVSKHGSFLSGVVEGLAICLSVALQHGTPFAVIERLLRNTQSGEVNDGQHTSLIDGIAQMIRHCIDERRKIVGADAEPSEPQPWTLTINGEVVGKFTGPLPGPDIFHLAKNHARENGTPPHKCDDYSNTVQPPHPKISAEDREAIGWMNAVGRFLPPHFGETVDRSRADALVKSFHETFPGHGVFAKAADTELKTRLMAAGWTSPTTQQAEVGSLQTGINKAIMRSLGESHDINAAIREQLIEAGWTPPPPGGFTATYTPPAGIEDTKSIYTFDSDGKMVSAKHETIIRPSIDDNGNPDPNSPAD